jgi:murein DD-endopeptidase MepM/ murein hydrolase activator NlpD
MEVCKKILLLGLFIGQHGASGQTVQTYCQNNDGHTVFCGITPAAGNCISENERLFISSEIDKHKLHPAGSAFFKKSSHPLFASPLRWKPGIGDFGHSAIVQYVNHDTVHSNAPLDYNCGSRSYYNVPDHSFHKGTDFWLWPFGWKNADSSYVEIVAAAPGVIIYKTDGNFDKNCVLTNSFWNAVYVQHSDGSVAWYGHMKKFSLTTKGIGDSVQAGEYLGTVGSSGNSNGPHLHFEVHDSSGKTIDPFAGTCNNFNADSWWVSQNSYNDQGINHVGTNKHLLEFAPCPSEDVSNESDVFSPGDSIYFFMYFRNIDTLDQINTIVHAPDNSSWRVVNFTHFLPFYTLGYHYISYKLPASAPTGNWNFEVGYKGSTYFHSFYISSPAAMKSLADEEDDMSVLPNPAGETFTVHIAKDRHTAAKLLLRDVLGRTLIDQCIDSPETQIACARLKRGIYFYTLESNGALLKTGKIVLE